MKTKKLLRKEFFSIRKKKYFEINKSFFSPLIKLIKKKIDKKIINLSSYYPTSFEVNILKIFEIANFRKYKILLPVIKGNKTMKFYKWQKNEVLTINKYGLVEPLDFQKDNMPDVILVPLLAYDAEKNRLGYGGGYYDRYLKGYLKDRKNTITVGIAFSFQKCSRIPISTNDIKLNYILTEQGIL